MAKEERVRGAIDLWYRAGFGEVTWASALQATADLLGGGAAAVIGHNRINSRVERIHVYGVDDTVNEYVARMSAINPRTHYSMKHPGPHVVTDYGVLPEAALRRHEFYDWLERHHGLGYFVGSRIYDDGPHTLLASVEFTRRHGHPDGDLVETFAHITPHIANAWRVAGMIEKVAGAANLVEMLMRQQSCGLVGLRGDGAVLFMNAAAEAAVRASDGLAVVDRQLRAARAANDRNLQEIIGRALRAASAADMSSYGGEALAVARPSGRMPYALQVMPSGAGHASESGEWPAALVLIADPDRRDGPSEAILRSLGLSPAEARIAQRLAQGRTLAEAARDLGVTHNTARAHLRSIFTKTRVRSQVELVRMLSELARLDGAG